MLSRSMFPHDIFSEMDRLQREAQRVFEQGSSIRGLSRGGFPALNIGSTPESVELYAFAPGLDPRSIDVSLERGVLTISAERGNDMPEADEKTTVHINERFAGRFRRVVTLPDDVDPDGVAARYRDGLLHINVKRRQAAKPLRIAVQ